MKSGVLSELSEASLDRVALPQQLVEEPSDPPSGLHFEHRTYEGRHFVVFRTGGRTRYHIAAVSS
jgi:hypothetical protein